jgi:hypothetical protein
MRSFPFPALVASQAAPGFQFLGFGYDLLYGNPLSTQGDADSGFRTNVFKFSYVDNQTTTDGKWQVPDKTTAIELNECSLEQYIKVIGDNMSYSEAIGVNVAGNFSGFNTSFQLSVDYQHVEQDTESHENVFAHVTCNCSAYDLTMHIFDHPEVDDDFVLGSQMLPAAYDEDLYMEFIREFGTHVLTQVRVGGRWGWQMEFTEQSFSHMEGTGVNISAGIAYAGKWAAGISFDVGVHHQDMIAVTKAVSHNSTFNVGGTFSPDVNTWTASVKDDPMPLQLHLLELSDLFTPLYLPNGTELDAKRESMRHAVRSYCEYVKKHIDPKAKCGSQLLEEWLI